MPHVPGELTALRAANGKLRQLLGERDAQIAELRTLVAALQAQVAELTARVQANSKNSLWHGQFLSRGSRNAASVTPYSHAAGQRPGHPPDGAIRRGDDLPVHAVLLVLARVEGPVFGDPVDGDQGAVDDDERVPGFLRCAQHGTQPRRGEHDRHGATGAGTGSGVRPGAFTSWPTPRSARCSTPGSTATGSSCDSGPGCGVCLPRAVEQQIVRSGDERLDITSVPSWHSRLVRFSGSVTCASATAWTRVVHREEFHATALLRPLFDRFLGSWLTRGRATDAKCSRLLGMERPPALRMARDA